MHWEKFPGWSFTVLLVSVTGTMAGVLAQDSPRQISFLTPDSGRVFAEFYGSRGPAVILAHGAIFNKESWAPLARFLASHKFRVLAIDFRGYGKSQPGEKGRALDEDILGAIFYLHRMGIRDVSILGASMGGGAAATAATRADSGMIHRLILLSPVPIARPDRIRAAETYYIVSREEPMAAAIRKNYLAAPAPRHWFELPGNAHAQHIFKTNQGPELQRLILQILQGK